jgi:5-dehydro-2-deoxygluconokinase
LESATAFGKFIRREWHEPTVAAARHGRSGAVMARTGDDPFGMSVHNQLRTSPMARLEVTRAATL